MKPTPNLGNTWMAWKKRDSDKAARETRAQQQIRRAKDALRSLQASKAHLGAGRLRWTEGVSEIFAENIDAVLDLAGDPNPPRQQFPDIFSKKNRKRRREDDSDFDEDSGKTGGHKRSKRTPSLSQIQYQPHPKEERADAWYGKVFQNLYKQTIEFVDEFFFVENPEDKGPWDVREAPEFISWADRVAEADPSTGGWKDLLQDPIQRQHLITAVIVLILKVKIFDVYLWGATQQQNDFLHGIERAFVNSEGFSRTAIRSENVRKIVDESPVTQFFYRDVETLTAQILLLLKPLTDHLHAHSPSGVAIPLIEEQHQALHNIISDAAYLSICTRMSPTIFFWSPATPGSYFTKENQAKLDHEALARSKKAVTKTYNRRLHGHTAREQATERRLQGLIKDGRELTYEGKAVQARLLRIRKQRPRNPLHHYRTAVKVGVWPSISRFKPGSADDDREVDGKKMALKDKRGAREYTISKARVVCYYGDIQRPYGERVRLAEYVKGKHESGISWVTLGFATGAISTAALMLANWGGGVDSLRNAEILRPWVMF